MISLTKAQRYWLEFILVMTEKEIKARYKHAILGFLWVILNPLLQMLVIGFVFQYFVPVKVENYFLFLFAGLLPWNFFSYSVLKATPSIMYERSLIQKAKFPRESIVLSIVLSHLFHFLVSLALFLLVLVAFWTVVSPQIAEVGRLILMLPALIAGIVWLTSLTAALSLLLGALQVRFRDVHFMTQAAMPLWIYITPVVYNLGLLPSHLQSLAYLNPMTGIIELFHFALLGLPPTQPELWVVSGVMSVVILCVGWQVFKRESLFFDDWI